MDTPCDVHKERLDKLEDSDKEQWVAINKLKERLPVWATIVISLLTFGLGCAFTYARMSQ